MRLTTAALAVTSGIFALLLSPPATAAVSSSDEAVDPDPVATHSLIDFDHSVSLESAVTVKAAFSEEVLGYHFESDSVIGDFWLDTNMSTDEFLAEIQSKTGTLPEVTGAYVAAPKKDSNQLRLANSVLTTDLPIFDAPDASPSAEFMSIDETQSQPSDKAEARDPIADRWEPSEAEIRVLDQLTTVYIAAKYQWSGVDPWASPLVTPDHWGMEFAIDFHTHMRGGIADPGWLRPNCYLTSEPGNESYKDWAAASNRPFDWFALVADGNGMPVAPATLGLYGDYNDLYDECTRSTIAVGMAAPWEMPWSTWGQSNLSIAMYPDRGEDSMSKIGANVQAVERHTCEFFSGIPLTDCMGADMTYTFPGPRDGVRLVANTSRNWYGPDICWLSNSFGEITANTFTVPCS